MTRLRRPHLAFVCVIAWASVALQFYSTLSRDFAFAALPGRIIDVLSYFTISTNILVAVVATAGLSSRWDGRRLTSDGVMTATAVYIFVVAVAYALLLKARAHQMGWPATWSNTGLHEIVPVFYIGYWLLYVRREQLKWAQAAVWLSYPAAYIAYTLARGAVTHRYPYYFANVDQLGYPRALANGAAFIAAFWLLGLLAIALSRIKRPMEKSGPA